MKRRYHLPIHELLIFFAQIHFRIHHVFRGTITHHPILIPYLLGFFGIYCRNPHLPLNGSNFSSMQTAESFKYNDLQIPQKDTIVVYYSTLSQKCTKLNTEKQNAQGHLGSSLTPERENRNFRKTFVANSTKPLCRLRGNL